MALLPLCAVSRSRAARKVRQGKHQLCASKKVRGLERVSLMDRIEYSIQHSNGMPLTPSTSSIEYTPMVRLPGTRIVLQKLRGSRKPGSRSRPLLRIAHATYPPRFAGCFSVNSLAILELVSSNASKKSRRLDSARSFQKKRRFTKKIGKDVERIRVDDEREITRDGERAYALNIE